MLPKIVLHKTNGHRHPPESGHRSLGDVLRLVHSARDGAAPTSSLLKFAHTVGNETATGLVEQVRSEIDALRLGLATSLAETRAAFARGELRDIQSVLDSARHHADFVGRLIGRLAAALADAPIERRLIDVNALVLRCVKRMRERLGPEASVKVRLTAQLPPVAAHPRRLEDALVILMTPPAGGEDAGERSVRVQTSRGRGVVKGEDTILIRIVHKPVGFGKPLLAAVASDPWALAAADETALDVYLARQFVSQHGGALSAENLAAGGARFAVELPTV